MPYIKKERREGLDKIAIDAVRELNWLAKQDDKQGLVGGDLNYLTTKIINTIFENNKGYAMASELVATLECVKMEFYRRKVAPYEEEKIVENGDV